MSHLRVHRVPGHAVDSPGVAAEHGDGLVPLDVEDVHLVVLGAGGHKGLVHAPETAVNHVKALKFQAVNWLQGHMSWTGTLQITITN